MTYLRILITVALFAVLLKSATAQQDAALNRYGDCVKRVKQLNFLYENALISKRSYQKQLMKDSCAAFLGMPTMPYPDTSENKQASPHLVLQYRINKLKEQGQRSTGLMGMGLVMIGCGFAFIYIKPNEGKYYNIRKGVGVAFLSAGALFEFIGIADRLAYKVKRDNINLQIGLLQSGNIGVNLKL